MARPTELARRLKSGREHAGLTEDEAAQRVNLASVKTLQRHESGRSLPHETVLTLYGTTYGIPLAELRELRDVAAAWRARRRRRGGGGMIGGVL